MRKDFCLNWWAGIFAGDAFLLDPEIIGRLEALTFLDFTDSNKNLMSLLNSGAEIWNMESMDVSWFVSAFNSRLNPFCCS